MKNIKKILFLVFIFLMTGCSVNYDLQINEDNSINEKVVATERTTRMETLTKLKGDQAISYLYNMFKRDNQNIKLSSKTQGNNTIATATVSYSDIQQYASNFSSDVFESASVTKKDGIVTLLMDQSKKLVDESGSSLVYDSIIVNITVPFSVIENNADKIEGNTYIWNIDKDSDLKTIKLSYKEGNKDNRVNIKLNNKVYNINYGIIVGICILFVVSIIVIIVSIKNKKNNIM